MKISRDESITRPFVLESNDIEKLSKHFEGWAKHVTYKINCKDSIEREFSSADELLKFENPPSKDIQSLQISGLSKDGSTHMWLRFGKYSVQNVYISLSGDEEVVMAANEFIEERLEAMRPWYAVMSLPKTILIVIGIFGLIATTIFFIGLIREGFPSAVAIRYWWVAPLSFLAGVITGAFITYMQSSLFPIGVFAIGQGAKRHKDKEIVRTVVILGFLVSLLASFVAAPILALWPK